MDSSALLKVYSELAVFIEFHNIEITYKPLNYMGCEKIKQLIKQLRSTLAFRLIVSNLVTFRMHLH